MFRRKSEVTVAKAMPKNKTIERLAVEAALALTAEYFVSPGGTIRISDVRPISSGSFRRAGIVGHFCRKLNN